MPPVVKARWLQGSGVASSAASLPVPTPPAKAVCQSSQSVIPKMASAAAARATSATSPPTTPPVKRARIAAVADTEDGSPKSPDPEGWTETGQATGEASHGDHFQSAFLLRGQKFKMAGALLGPGFLSCSQPN